MVAIYCIRLEEEKRYFGMTTKNVERLIQHVIGEGSIWTKKYPPIENFLEFFEEDLYPVDENLKTLEMMKKYGIDNVRGGKWHKIELSSKQIREIKKGIENLSQPQTKSRPEIGLYYKERAIRRKKRRYTKNGQNKTKSNFRGVLLPMGTTPVNTCRAMKKDGKGRCWKKIKSSWAGKASEDQLCPMHRISAKGGKWRTISEDEMQKGW